MRKIVLLIFIVHSFIFSNITLAQSSATNQDTFTAGNDFFEKKNYDEAIKTYASLLERGLESEELYFNLGNCYYQKKEWGKAILHYERALLIDPNDKATLQNLQLAKSNTLDEIEKIPTFFLARWWGNIRQLTSSGIWSLLGILLLWIGIGGLVLWILGKERAQRKKGFLVGWGSLGVGIIVFALAYHSFKIQQNSGTGIIMSKEIALKSLPDSISEEIMLLHEGTKVEITEKIASWYKVRLENGEVGWIDEQAIEEI
ncbi:MAG: tetratricopeptide repeat protein [Bacteroidota bacterium]